MPNNHIVTKDTGNLRGFSTDSIYLRPPNVADIALNVQKAPDSTIQLRRGYQCQASPTGGMGLGTLDNPTNGAIETVTIGTDGNLYKKEERQIYLVFDGRVTGTITGITLANPAVVESIGHGLVTGTQVIIRNVVGFLNAGASINGFTFTITVLDADHFSLDGLNSSAFSAYTSGGTWSLEFADSRYLTFSIFVDPLLIYANANQNIACKIITNRSAQIVGNQGPTNTITVKIGHTLGAGDSIQFTSAVGVLEQRSVVSSTTSSITVSGTPVSVTDQNYIDKINLVNFGKGFDSLAPFTVQQFIDAITGAIGVTGLQVAVNGLTTSAAAFLQIVEPTIINSPSTYTINYWYWTLVNSAGATPFPASANPEFQNSDDFENASMAVFDDVIYIANGWNFPQKYDRQTVYRTGMPLAVRVSNSDNTGVTAEPFSSGNVFEYATTYEQIDNLIHSVEGEVSEINRHTVGTTPSAINVVATNLKSSGGANWNTNGALFRATENSVVYGPDRNNFWYDVVKVTAGYTLKIGDSAYYADSKSAFITSTTGAATLVLDVAAGHTVLPDDLIYFLDAGNVYRQRIVASITATTITIRGDPVILSIATVEHQSVLSYRVSKVFGNVAIVDTTQVNPANNNILVDTGYQLVAGETVEFVDSSGNLQRRVVTATPDATHVTLSGIPISINDGTLIYSIGQQTDTIILQRLNFAPLATITGKPISNNLRINIYRTKQGQSFENQAELFLIASIPNDSITAGTTQTYVDSLSDAETFIEFDDPDEVPNPPPISKYLRAYGNQMFYAGGERGNPVNSDRVFFSDGDSPETVPTATFFLNFPNTDDDVTGLGVAGTTLVVTKTHSLWALAGDPLGGNPNVVQISPGANIGCISHASIASVGGLMYFLHASGVYAITENQLFPTDNFGNPIALSVAIEGLFREQNFLPQNKLVLKRSVAVNYTQDNQYLLFIPCEDTQTTIRDANSNSVLLCYDYQHKNWFWWSNMNCAGGMAVIKNDLYFQERRFSGVNGNTANIYKQHRFYRLIDHADHAGAQFCEWRSSWEDLGQPMVRKKFSKCVLLMDRVSDLMQKNNPTMTFTTYLNRIPNLPNTVANVNQVVQSRNAPWSLTAWNWNYWSGYQDSFVAVNLKRGTVAKSIQIGLKIQGINMDMRFAGYQLEAIPENRVSMIR